MANESEENGQNDGPKARIGDIVSVDLVDPKEIFPPLSGAEFQYRVLMCLMKIADAGESKLKAELQLHNAVYDLYRRLDPYSYGPVQEVIQTLQTIKNNANNSNSVVTMLQMIATSLSDMALHVHEGIKAGLSDEIQKALIEENINLRKKLAEIESKEKE